MQNINSKARSEYGKRRWTMELCISAAPFIVYDIMLQMHPGNDGPKHSAILNPSSSVLLKENAYTFKRFSQFTSSSSRH